MKKILFTFLFIMAFLAGFTQMNNNGGNITVQANATLVIQGDYTSSGGGIIDIDGTMDLKGDFINNSGSVAVSSFGNLKFSGTSPQEITGIQSTTFYCSVEVNNGGNGVALTNTQTGANQFLDSTLILTSGDVTLNGFNLTMSNEGATGASASSHVVTNLAGQLRAGVGSGNYTFPVGDGTYYNPLILNEAALADTFGVTFTGALPSGWTGGATHNVLGHWTVTEKVADVNNLTATAQWNTGQEQTFDRTDCAVGVSTDLGATVAWKASGAAVANAGAWTRTSVTGLNTVGKILVADYFFEGIDLDLDVFLAGPYNAGTMSTALLASNLIPKLDPYGNNSKAVSSIPANVVDWIEVELRTTPTTLTKSYSFFLDKNGNVLDSTGAVGTKLTGVSKAPYYVVVRHRNHLGARNSSTIDFTTGSSFAFDFSAGGGIFGTFPMRNMGAKWALWAGDTDGNGSVQFATGTSDITPISATVLSGGNTDPTIPSGLMYSLADADMNGTVQFATGTSDITPISATVLSNGNTDPTIAKNQQLP